MYPKNPDKCPKPDCPVPIRQIPSRRCICYDSIHIVIPAGGHIHLTCPVHGDRIVYGPQINWSITHNKREQPYN